MQLCQSHHGGELWTFAKKVVVAVAALVAVATTLAAQSRDSPASLAAWAMDPRMPKGCHCPCTMCTPQCNAFGGGVYFGTQSGFAAPMAGSLIGSLLAAAFAPVGFDSSDDEAQLPAAQAERKRKDAVPEFEQALRLAPYVPKLHYNAALLHGQLKRYKDALRLMQVYLQAAPDAPDTRAAENEIFAWELQLERQAAR